LGSDGYLAVLLVRVPDIGLLCDVYENWGFINGHNEKPNPLSVFIQGFVESLVFINGFMKTQIHFCFTQGRRAL